MSNLIRKRQDLDNDDDVWWGYSDTGTAVKWSIVGLILLLIFSWLLGGYFHAQRRIKRGKPPLAYHKFLVPRHQRARFEPQPAFTFNQHQGYGQEYPMHAYPPPAYSAQQPPPPTYQVPEGGSKVNPDQGSVAASLGPSTGNSQLGESSTATQNVPHEQGTALSDQGNDTRPHLQESRPRPHLVARLNPFNRG